MVFIERIALSIKTFNTYRYLTKYTHSYRLQDMKKTTLSERLNIAMQKRGMTQGALAKASGVAQPTIWRLTSGGAKASRKVVDIANALKVSVDWLANGDGEMEDDGKEYQIPAHSKASPSGMFPVNIWDKDNELDGVVFVPEAVKSDSCRAYILEKNSGCAEAPAGTIVVIDTNETPGTGDLVYAKVKDGYSVYRFLDGGSAGFLTVDDERVPIIDIANGSIIGVAVFLLRDLKRKR